MILWLIVHAIVGILECNVEMINDCSVHLNNLLNCCSSFLPKLFNGVEVSEEMFLDIIVITFIIF